MASPPTTIMTGQVHEPGRKARQSYAESERRALIEQMIEQRIRTGASWEQVAANHNVSLHTAERWRASDDWRQAEHRWRRILRGETRTRIVEIAGQAVDVLITLMGDPTTPAFTRYNCAKALLEFAGIADEFE